MELTRPPRAPAGRARAGLLFESARPYYDAYAGDEARARALLAAVYPRTGHAASFEVCLLAEADGTVGGRRWPAIRCATATGSRAASSADARRACRRGAGPDLVRHLRAAGASRPQPAGRRLVRRRAGRRARLAAPAAWPGGCSPRPRRPPPAPACAAWRSTPASHNAPARALYEALRLRRARAAPRARRRHGPRGRRPGLRGLLQGRPAEQHGAQRLGDLRHLATRSAAGRTAARPSARRRPRRPGTRPSRWPKRSR